MTSTAIVTRYATAFVDVIMGARSGLDALEALRQVKEVAKTYTESKDLRTVLASPSVSIARKRAIIKRLSEQLGVHPHVRNFFLVLVDHRRAGIIPEIVAAFDELLDARMGFVRVNVKSAHELSAARTEELGRRFGEISGAKPRVAVEVDPDLIGGVIVRVGSRVYDGSVRGQLAALKRRLEV
jgi:F-type H+-transporting ATPase subunit delta